MLEEAALNREAAKAEAEAGEAAKLLGLTEPQDVVRTVGSILGRRSAASDMKRLAADLRGNPEAIAGLRQAVVDHVLTKYIGNTEVATSGVAQIKADQYQTFVKANREALLQVFKPEEVARLEKVAEDLMRAKRSETAVKMPASPGTAQDLLAASKGQPTTVLGVILQGAGAAVGAVLQGPVGAAVGSAAATLIQGLRLSGVERIEQLVTKAMLEPKVARALLQKVPRNPPKNLVRARRAALIKALQTGSVASGDRREETPKPPVPAMPAGPAPNLLRMP
jgi:hypothetical protein